MAPTVAGSIPVSHPSISAILSHHTRRHDCSHRRNEASLVSTEDCYWSLRVASDAESLGATAVLDLHGHFFLGRVVGFHVVVEDLDELGDDLVAFERGEQASIHIHRRLRFFSGSGQRDTEAGVL